MKAHRVIMQVGLVAAMGMTLANAAFAQTDRTVRTGSGGSQDVSSIENSRTIYNQVQNVISGRLDILDTTIDTNVTTLEDLRRQINNITTVTYRTETVYVDRPVVYTGDDGGSDDGGGGDGGGDGGCG